MALLPCLPVSVDDFRESLGLSAHLLTHVHSSHLKGLRDGWKGGKIYCTKVTRELLLARFDIAPSRVMPLSLDIEHVLPARDPATGKEVLSNLTLIDANHCPGSAMFLLKGEFGCILHTGDFRASTEMLSSTPLRNAKVDLLIIDNTFCHPRFDMPPRPEALKQIVEIAANNTATHRLLIGLDGLGKEELLVAIADTLKTHVCVSLRRMQTIRLSGFPTDRFVCDQSWTGWRVKVVERRKLTRALLQEYHEEKPTMGIIASGRAPARHNRGGGETGSGPGGAASLHYVPFSLHSSFPELENFVSTLKPRGLWGLVSSDETDMHKHFTHLLSTPLYQPAMRPGTNMYESTSSSHRPAAYPRSIGDDEGPDVDSQGDAPDIDDRDDDPISWRSAGYGSSGIGQPYTPFGQAHAGTREDVAGEFGGRSGGAKQAKTWKHGGGPQQPQQPVRLTPGPPLEDFAQTQAQPKAVPESRPDSGNGGSAREGTAREKPSAEEVVRERAGVEGQNGGGSQPEEPRTIKWLIAVGGDQTQCEDDARTRPPWLAGGGRPRSVQGPVFPESDAGGLFWAANGKGNGKGNGKRGGGE